VTLQFKHILIIDGSIQLAVLRGLVITQENVYIAFTPTVYFIIERGHIKAIITHEIIFLFTF
tara:strand:- start:117 stop:302 length:186 start_codon:yes stop_codon:yes gene_type:complete